MVNTLNFIATIKIYYSWHILSFFFLQDIKILLRCFSSRSSTQEKQRIEWVPKIDWPNSYLLFDSTKRKIFPNHIFFFLFFLIITILFLWYMVSKKWVWHRSNYTWLTCFLSFSLPPSLSMTFVFLHTN
jgi:hypothetical protein